MTSAPSAAPSSAPASAGTCWPTATPSGSDGSLPAYAGWGKPGWSRWRPASRGCSRSSLRSRPLATCALALAVGAFLRGAWNATTPDPSGIDEQRCAKLSTRARSLLLAGLFAAPVSALRGHVPLPEAMIRLTTSLLLAAGFAGILATVRYFQRLTLRIPDGRLFAALESYFRFLLIAVSAATLSVWILNLFFEHPPAWFATQLACVLVAPLLFMVIPTLFFFSICSDLADHLNAQAATAAKLWPEE